LLGRDPLRQPRRCLSGHLVSRGRAGGAADGALRNRRLLRGPADAPVHRPARLSHARRQGGGAMALFLARFGPHADKPETFRQALRPHLDYLEERRDRILLSATMRPDEAGAPVGFVWLI